MAEESTVAEQKTNDALREWQRLSPIAVLYFLFSGLKHFASNFIYILPALAIGWSNLKERPYIVAPILLAMLGGGLITSLLSFYFYRFRLTEDHVEIRSGVLSKKTINLPFERIQNVTLERPVYYRMTGYACLLLDTAGSAQQEAKIVAMPQEDAEALRKAILRAHKQPQLDSESSEPDTSGVASADEQLLNERSVKDLVLHGLTNNRFWIIVGALAPFYDEAFEFMAEQAGKLGIDLVHVYDPETQSFWELFQAVSMSVLFVIAIMTLASILGAIIMFYGYTLHKTGDRYIRRSGLITRQEVSMKRSRIQVIRSDQDWLDIYLGRFNLYLLQNKSGSAEDPNNTQIDKILVPSIKADERDLITHDAFPECNTSTEGFIRISPRFVSGVFLIGFSPIILILLTIGFFSQHPEFYVIAGIASLLFTVGLLLRWNRWGYRLDDEYLCIRKGFLGVDYLFVPIYKVQQVKFKQSIMMKKRNLATAKLVMASGSQTLPYIPEDICRKLIDTCLYKVESEQKAWM